jgi:hypothetical protein
MSDLGREFAEQGLHGMVAGTAATFAGFRVAGWSPEASASAVERTAAALNRIMATPEGRKLQGIMRHVAVLEGSPADATRAARLEKKFRQRLVALARQQGDRELAALLGAASTDGAEHG